MIKDTLIVILCYAIIPLLVLMVWIIQTSHEMQTFNKFKAEGKPEATFWDAAFCELRVEAGH